MTTTVPHPAVQTLVLTLGEMPTFTPNTQEALVPQITHYLQQLLEAHLPANQEAPYVLLPPTYDLAGFFHCPELYVFEALQAMERQAYEYEIRGLDCPICLRDPMARRPVKETHGKWLQPGEFRWPALTFGLKRLTGKGPRYQQA
jgi:hypothetical protein